jgi:hypothetical protein
MRTEIHVLLLGAQKRAFRAKKYDNMAKYSPRESGSIASLACANEPLGALKTWKPMRWIQVGTVFPL